MNRRLLLFNGETFLNNYSVKFNGIDQYISAGTVSSFNCYHGATNPSGFAFSISMWVKLINPNQNKLFTIINTNGGTSSNVGIFFSIDSRTSVPKTRAIRALISRGIFGTSVSQNISGNNIYPNNSNWNHILWTYDQSPASNNSNFYINNILVFTANKSGSLPTAGSNASYPMHIGINQTLDSITAMEGNLYHVSLFNKVLNSTERTELFNNPHKNVKLFSFGDSATNAFRFPNGQANYPTWHDYVGFANGTMTNQISSDIISDIP